MTLDEITAQIDALNTRASELVQQAESGGNVAEVKALVENEIKPQLDVLTQEREKTLRAEEVKSLRAQVTSLESVMEEMRKPQPGFAIGSVKDPEGKAASDDPYFNEDGTFKSSVFVDIHMAHRGDPEARKRLAHGIESFEGKALTPEGKAMTEGTNAQGGYLVRPQLERQLVLAREKDNILRGLCTVLPINTTGIQLDQLGLSTTAGWVAELAAKPEGTAMTLATITASIFTAAGLATISNQLLQDSNPAVDQLATSDLTKRLVALEEDAFLNGSGTNQPLGLLNTPGLHTTSATVAGDPSASGGLLDNVLDAIADVQTSWGQPTAIVMHPRTWTRILKSRDANGHYTINPQPTFGAGYDVTTPRTYVAFPAITLFGVQVFLSNRIPTNLGTGTNESRVIVGDFREALILDRQGITVDESPHVFFTTNQTVFRAESRVGFTAARSPQAFNVIGGTGLASG